MGWQFNFFHTQPLKTFRIATSINVLIYVAIPNTSIDCVCKIVFDCQHITIKILKNKNSNNFFRVIIIVIIISIMTDTFMLLLAMNDKMVNIFDGKAKIERKNGYNKR